MKNDTSTATVNDTDAEARPQRKGIFIQMTEGQHRDLKVKAAQSGTTLQNLVSGLLSEAIDREVSGRRNRNAR